MNPKILICLLSLIVYFRAMAQEGSRPNVLIIYTDDHRYTGVHALGGQAVHTPNLDELAASGMAFTRA
ncbi:MAG: sulfatase, partial [Bacteroidota bacterium]